MTITFPYLQGLTVIHTLCIKYATEMEWILEYGQALFHVYEYTEI